MSFSCILRPKLCQIASFLTSPQCFHRTGVSLTCSFFQIKGNHVTGQGPTRGYRKKIDVSHLKPLSFDYSEDLVKQEPIDPKEITFKYRDVPELEQLPDHVKKLFTLEYATGQERLEHRNALLLDKVSNLVGPGPCLEKDICFLTTKIRNLIPYIVSDRRNKKHKSYLIERITRRKQLLTYLRRLDYDRFLWLLKELKLTYSSPNHYIYWKRSRKALVKRTAREDMIDERKQKLEDIRQKLEAEKESFYEMKEKVLQEIDDDIKELGLNKVEVLKEFETHMQHKRQQAVVESKKLNRLQTYIKEQKLQKEKDSRVF